jgi:hypothetical protein
MTSPTITVHIVNVDTEPMLDAQAMSLLYGVHPEEITALPMANGAKRIPDEWVRRSRRRYKEAMAANGSDFILDVLQHWAWKDHGADLEVVYG